MDRAKKAVGELQTYVASQGLFLPPALKHQFSEMLSILWRALTSKEVGHEAEDWKMQSKGWKELQATHGGVRGVPIQNRRIWLLLVRKGERTDPPRRPPAVLPP